MEALATLIEVLKAGGPYAMAALLILAYLSERKDRREKDTQLRAVHERKDAELRAIYEKTVILVQESTRGSDRMQAALTALKDAITALSARLR